MAEEAIVAHLHLPGMAEEKHTLFRQNIRGLGQGSKQGHPAYNSRMLSLR
jgi:hypothetical protein